MTMTHPVDNLTIATFLTRLFSRTLNRVRRYGPGGGRINVPEDQRYVGQRPIVSGISIYLVPKVLVMALRRFTKKALWPLLIAAFTTSTGVKAEAEFDAHAVAEQEWHDIMDDVTPLAAELIGLLNDPEDAQLRQEMYRMLMAGISVGYMGRFLGDEEHPDFWPMLNMAFNFWAPNPDDVYYLAPLDPSGIYRVTGVRGTVRIIDMQIGSGDIIPRGTGSLGPALNNYDLDTLEIANDGGFSVILSADRPEAYEGNWLKLGETASYLLIRQIAYDWVNEIDARFSIERLDTPPIKPRQSADEIRQNLKTVITWAKNWSLVGPNWVNQYFKEDLVNKFKVGTMGSGGTTSQQYIEGLFKLEDDEALIYESDVPECRYWNIQLSDMLWQPIDYMNRQSHLNGFQARLDGDGRLRAVISARDPGVPNWLDTAGYGMGSFVGRWRECDHYPTPTVTKVKLADLRTHLPAETPVVSAAQRDQDIRLRKRGAQLRRRW
jgi:Protein of unknown function (DUF1214)